MGKLLWEASRGKKCRCVMRKFINYVNAREGQSIRSYDQLHAWSVSEPLFFWNDVWDYFGIIGSKPFNCSFKSRLYFKDSVWFPGAKINYAENMLKHMYGEDEGIVFRGEDKVRRSLSRDEVRHQVVKMAKALLDAGVEKGMVIAGYLPNLPETVIAMLASAAIGAIWCSCATDIGPGAAIDRIGQTEPVVLVTTDGYYYKGKTFPVLPNAKVIADAIPSIKKVIVVHYAGSRLDGFDADDRWTTWEEMTAPFKGEVYHFPRFPYEQPLVIMFSSGTTGKPKCMVQSAMGLLLNQLKELGLHSDMALSDSLLYITTCSWMMWNWQAASIGLGVRLVLFDGNPSYPDHSTIWKIIEEEKVTIFGLSASYIHGLIRDGFVPKDVADLTHLREVSQTGSALSEQGFNFIYEKIKQDLFFNSIAGGTDINGCFAIANPLKPVYSGELQGPGLGMDIDCFDEKGNSIRDREGELVCKIPAPSMPLYFWNDEGGKRYHNAYFSVFPGIWMHGDYVTISSATGGVTFNGRSDSVLKPSGVRIGTVEIYNIVENLEEVKESLAIGQDLDEDQRVILFVQCKDGYALDDALRQKIKTDLRTKASPRHVPAVMIQVNDIPHTHNGKKVESAVTNIMNGRDVTNRDALANPGSLEEYIRIKAAL